MKPDELRFALTSLGISQTDFARLIDVTPRAITLWLGSERGIPGSVEAYLRVMLSLPPSQRQPELARINTGVATMKDGMYMIEFSGAHGTGYAALIFEGGRIYGSDVGRGQYDGQYSPNLQTGAIDVKVRVQMPANVQSVVGITQPFDWMLDVETSFDPARDAAQISVRSTLGHQIAARYEFMRSLPN